MNTYNYKKDINYLIQLSMIQDLFVNKYITQLEYNKAITILENNFQHKE